MKVERVMLLTCGSVDRRLRGERTWLSMYWRVRQLAMVEQRHSDERRKFSMEGVRREC